MMKSMVEIHPTWAPSYLEQERVNFEEAVLMDALHEMALRAEWDRSALANPCHPYLEVTGCECCRHYGPCIEFPGQAECRGDSCTQCDDSDED